MNNEWWNTTINETLKILKNATALDDNEHTFFISGSNAVIFFINELLTTDYHLLNQEQQNNLINITQKIKKPNDLDIKYKDIDFPLFFKTSTRIKDKIPANLSLSTCNNLSLSLSSIYEDIDTCTHYIDIDAFRASLTQIGSDAMFKKRKDGKSIFSNIDFDRYRKKGFKIATINNIKIMGLDDLIEVYEDNKGPLDEVKIEALKIIKYCIENNYELMTKYIGTKT
jgi:hypothetical protein